MTQRRATQRRTSLEKHQDEVIALLLTGSTPTELAVKYKVHRVSVCRFMKRHEDRLGALQKEVTHQVEDYAIAQKVNRIAALDDRWQRMHTVIEERGELYKEVKGGGKSGLVVEQYKSDGDGGWLKEYKVDSGLLAEMRAVERAAAEELAQLPKPSINIDNRTLNVFSIQIDDGSDPSA